MQEETENERNEENETLTESNSNINTISDLPGRPFTISVEFPLLLVMIALTLSGTVINNIILYRTCIHSLHHSEDECHIFLAPHKRNGSEVLEKEVQKYAVFVTTVKIIIESVGPAVLSCFLGVWSDTYGRKPLIVWPLLGMAMSSVMTCAYSMMHLGPWWYVLTTIPLSLTGSFTVLFTGAFCYLSDITSKEKISLRMTVLEAAVSLGSIIGAMTSAYLLKLVGGVYLLLIVSTLLVIAYVFSVICLDESLNGALRGGLSTVFDLLLVKEMTRECFKRRPNKGRAQILLLTLANVLSIFILYGVMSLDYLYTRHKLGWALKEYNTFTAVSTSISFGGSFLGAAVIQRYCHVTDLMFTLLAFLTGAIEYVIRCFATASWYMYLGASIAIFKGLSAPLIRSFLTKILPVEDISKVFAFLCALEGVCPLLAPEIFNSLYAVTLESFPGSVYVLSAVITFTSLVLVGFVQYYRWNTTTPYQILEYPSPRL